MEEAVLVKISLRASLGWIRWRGEPIANVALVSPPCIHPAYNVSMEDGVYLSPIKPKLSL